MFGGGWIGKNGYWGVEFFFIISGVFLAKSVEKEQGHYQKQLSNYTYGKIVKKYLYYVRYYMIALLLLVVKDIICSEKMKGIVFNLLFTIPHILLLGQLGFNDESYYPYGYYVSGSWFLSVLFILFCLFFPIMNWNYKFFVNIVASTLFLISFSLLLVKYGKVSVAFEAFTMGQAGILRGICELCIGCIIYEISKLVKRSVITRIGEMVILIVIFVFMCIDVTVLAEFFMLLITAAGVLCIIVNDQRDINNSVFLYLGKISFPLLFLHEPVRIIMSMYISNKTVHRIAFYLISFMVSALVMYVVERLLNKIKCSGSL